MAHTTRNADTNTNAHSDQAFLILRPSPHQWLLIFGGCAMFVLLAVGLRMEPWITWMTLIFFGGGGVLSLVQLIPGSAELRISRRGFTTRQFFRDRFVPWGEVKRFFVVAIRASGSTTKIVAFNYRPDSPLRGRRHALSRQMTGCDASLRDMYGYDVGELAEMMERWRSENNEAGEGLRGAK